MWRGFPSVLNQFVVEASKMSKISCLYRIDAHDDDLEYISLENQTQVTLGRDVMNDVILNKSKFISRQHARLVKENVLWTITDLNSSNGVFVNGRKIDPAIPIPLSNKDLLELGKDPHSGQAHYTFRYYKAVYIKFREDHDKCQKENDSNTCNFRAPPLKRVRDNVHEPSVAVLRRQMAEKEQQVAEKERLVAQREQELEQMKREMDEKQQELAHKQKLEQEVAAMQEELQQKSRSQELLSEHVEQLQRNKHIMETELEQERIRLETLLKEEQGKLTSIEDMLRCQMAEKEKQVAEKEKLMAQREQEMENMSREMMAKEQQMTMRPSLEDAIKTLQQQLDEKRRSQEQMTERVNNLQRDKQTLQIELEKEKHRLEDKARNEKELRGKVSSIEDEMQRKLEEKEKQVEEQERLRAEHEQEVDHLRQEMLERQLELAQKQQLEQAVADMHKELQLKAQSQEQLAENVRQLQESKHSLETELEREKHRLEAKQQEEEALKGKVTSIEDAMEEELVCTICSELFVKAMSLSCSHAFCHYCIVSWLLRKQECPNCRSTITSCVPCIVLDNTIDRIAAQLGTETQQRRAQMVQERKAEEQELEDKLKTQPRGVQNLINRILNRSQPAAADDLPGTSANPINLDQFGRSFQQTVFAYLSPTTAQNNARNARGAGTQNALPVMRPQFVVHSQQTAQPLPNPFRVINNQRQPAHQWMQQNALGNQRGQMRAGNVNAQQFGAHAQRGAHARSGRHQAASNQRRGSRWQ